MELADKWQVDNPRRVSTLELQFVWESLRPDSWLLNTDTTDRIRKLVTYFLLREYHGHVTVFII